MGSSLLVTQKVHDFRYRKWTLNNIVKTRDPTDPTLDMGFFNVPDHRARQEVEGSLWIDITLQNILLQICITSVVL